MDWSKAKDKIRSSIKVNTDLNTPKSTYRLVKKVNAKINSDRYIYNDELGFIVQIGKTSDVRIPWSMLQICFDQLKSLDGYDGRSFREQFPLQAKDHPCHVHVVGQIFVAAGIAIFESKKYRLH